MRWRRWNKLMRSRFCRSRGLCLSAGFAVLPSTRTAARPRSDRCSETIDVLSHFGEEPDSCGVDAHILAYSKSHSTGWPRTYASPGHRLAAHGTARSAGTMVRAGIGAPMRPDSTFESSLVAVSKGLLSQADSGFAPSCPIDPALVGRTLNLTYRPTSISAPMHWPAGVLQA